MIVDLIYEYMRSDLVVADETQVDTATRLIGRSLKRNLTAVEREGKRGISASSSWYCARRIILGLRDTERVPVNPRSRVAFFMGDTLEQMGILLSRLAGVDVVSPAPDGTQEAIEVELAGEKIPCHLDQVIRAPDGSLIPVDWKSMATWGFEEFEEATRNPAAKWWTEERWGYLSQLRIYMLAKKAPYGIFCAVDKNTGNMAELTVPRDPVWEQEILARIQYLQKHRDSPTLPPRPEWATAKRKDGLNLRPDGTKGPVEEIENWRCNYCPFVATCWPGFGLVLTKKPAWRRPV